MNREETRGPWIYPVTLKPVAPGHSDQIRVPLPLDRRVNRFKVLSQDFDASIAVEGSEIVIRFRNTSSLEQAFRGYLTCLGVGER